MLDRLTVEDFAALIGDAFGAPDGVTLELVAAEGLGPARSGPDGRALRAPYRLEWAGPPEPQLPSATVPLEHPSLGRLELFLGPVAREPDGSLRYEAVFG